MRLCCNGRLIIQALDFRFTINGEKLMKKILYTLCIVGCLSFPSLAAINHQNNGDGTSTITLSYTTDTARVVETLGSAAQFLYVFKGIGLVYSGEDIVPYANLSNPQRLNIIDVAVRKIIIQWARNWHVTTAVETARDTAEGEDLFIEE